MVGKSTKYVNSNKLNILHAKALFYKYFSQSFVRPRRLFYGLLYMGNT